MKMTERLQQGAMSRFSFRRATIIVCFLNLIIGLFVIHAFLSPPIQSILFREPCLNLNSMKDMNCDLRHMFVGDNKYGVGEQLQHLQWPRSAPCLDDQKALLLSLKNQLTFDSSLSTKLVGWNQSVECCAWGGVTCDKAGRVTRLDLSHEGIHGRIPSAQKHWEGLSRLEYLSMSYNSLTGELPKPLLTLPSLEDLDLSYNRLSGQVIDVAPYQPRLRNLELSHNWFEGPIPGFIFKLSALSTLALSANRFSGRLDLDKFGKLTELYAIDLSYNKLTVSVSSNFSLQSKLNSVMLASCNLQVVPDLKNQSRLLMLDLSDNQLRGEIPNWIWELGNRYLWFLNLSHNQFSSLEKPYTFPFLLDVLDLHSNRLQGEIPIPPRRTKTY